MAFPIPQCVDQTGLALHRVIASNYPPIDLFEDVSTAAEFGIAIEYEAITSDRMTDELGRIRAIDEQDLLLGPGSTPVMAAFAYPNQYARFNTPERGAYYAANSLEGALAEHSYHWLNDFLADARIGGSPEPVMAVREYRNELARPLHDICNEHNYAFALHDTDYTESQRFADTLRENERSNGLLYRSRRSDCLCVATFKPAGVTHCTQGKHFKYTYQGGQIQIEEAA